MESIRLSSFINKKTHIIVNIAIISSSISLGYLLGLLGVPKSLAIYMGLPILCLALTQTISTQKVYKNIAVLSYFFSLMTLIGLLLESGLNLSWIRLGVLAVSAISVGVIVYYVVYALIFMAKKEPVSIKLDKFDAKTRFLIGAVAVLISWIPTLLAFFPGLFSVDAPDQAMQTIGTYTTHHPLLHTLFLQWCLNIGRYICNTNLGIFIYVIIQTMIMASIFSLGLGYAIKKKVPSYFLIGMMMIYSIYPVTATMAITTTKDSLFSVFFMAFVLLIIMVVEDDENNDISPTHRIGLFVFGLLCMLFRNNAVIIIPFSFIMLFFTMNKKHRKTVLIVGSLVIISYFFMSLGLKMYTKATDDPTNAEMLSVPCQQLARVYSMEKDSLTEQEENEILKYIPDAALYNPLISDNTKNTEKIDYDVWGFMRLYSILLKRYPMRYLESFLINTKGYWDLNDTSCNNIVGPSDNVGYLWLYFWGHEGADHIKLLPSLEEWYYNWFCLNRIEEVPILNTLFRFGLFTWPILFSHAIVLDLCEDRKRYLPVFASIELLLLTYMLGPCAYPRYAFPFIILAPVIIAMTNATKKQNDNT